jgi:hypothetical protein
MGLPACLNPHYLAKLFMPHKIVDNARDSKSRANVAAVAAAPTCRIADLSGADPI